MKTTRKQVQDIVTHILKQEKIIKDFEVAIHKLTPSCYPPIIDVFDPFIVLEILNYELYDWIYYRHYDCCNDEREVTSGDKSMLVKGGDMNSLKELLLMMDLIEE